MPCANASEFFRYYFHHERLRLTALLAVKGPKVIAIRTGADAGQPHRPVAAGARNDAGFSAADEFVGMCRGHDAPLRWAGALPISQSPMDADGGAVMDPAWNFTYPSRCSILLTFQKLMISDAMADGPGAKGDLGRSRLVEEAPRGGPATFRLEWITSDLATQVSFAHLEIKPPSRGRGDAEISAINDRLSLGVKRGFLRLQFGD